MQCSKYGQWKGLSIAPGGLVIQAFISSAHLMESNNWQKFYREGWNWEKQLYPNSDRQIQIVTLKWRQNSHHHNTADCCTIPPKFPFSHLLAVNLPDGSDGASNYKLPPISTHYITAGEQTQTILFWPLIFGEKGKQIPPHPPSCIPYYPINKTHIQRYQYLNRRSLNFWWSESVSRSVMSNSWQPHGL